MAYGDFSPVKQLFENIEERTNQALTEDKMGFGEVKKRKEPRKHPKLSDWWIERTSGPGRAKQHQYKQLTQRQKMRASVRGDRQDILQGKAEAKGWWGYYGTKQKTKRRYGFGRQKAFKTLGSNTATPGNTCPEGVACFATK